MKNRKTVASLNILYTVIEIYSKEITYFTSSALRINEKLFYGNPGGTFLMYNLLLISYNLLFIIHYLLVITYYCVLINVKNGWLQRVHEKRKIILMILPVKIHI